MIRSSVHGIFQSDILIRTAIIQALREIKEQPWLLDYAFAWLINDDLTRATYGEKELEEAKSWFMNTEIAVSMAYRQDRPQLPMIGIELIESTESNATLSDTHYTPSEEILASEIVIKPRPVLGPFTPKSYSSTTGYITLPDSLTTASIFSGMYIYDSTINRGYQILQVIDSSTFTIDEGVRANFTKAYIAPRDNFYRVPIHSLLFREAYRIRCFVSGNPVHLSFLYSILLFVMLRGKQELLEGRGFENSTIAGAGVGGPFKGPSDPEMFFTRDLTITGFARQYWPGTPTQKLDGILVDGLRVLSAIGPNEALEDEEEEQGWGIQLE